MDGCLCPGQSLSEILKPAANWCSLRASRPRWVPGVSTVAQTSDGEGARVQLPASSSVDMRRSTLSLCGTWPHVSPHAARVRIGLVVKREASRGPRVTHQLILFRTASTTGPACRWEPIVVGPLELNLIPSGLPPSLTLLPFSSLIPNPFSSFQSNPANGGPGASGAWLMGSGVSPARALRDLDGVWWTHRQREPRELSKACRVGMSVERDLGDRQAGGV